MIVRPHLAFKDLSAQVAEEFAETQQAAERTEEAEQARLRLQAEKDRLRSLERHERDRFLKRASTPSSHCKVFCACCRAPCVTAHQLATHYAAAHPSLNAAYKVHLAALEAEERARSLVLRDLHAAERQLAASRDLTLALEERVALLTARLRGI